MAVFSERVTAITYNDIMPTIVDAVNNSNILTARVMSNVKNWKGVNMKQPIRIANSTTGGSFDGLGMSRLMSRVLLSQALKKL